MNAKRPPIILITLFLLQAVHGFAQKNAVPAKYAPLLATAFSKAGSNRTELEKALREVPANMKEAAAFLIAYMPDRDLQSLTSDFLVRDIRLAYKAKVQYPWTRRLPDSIFLNEVLPYAVLNEQRDDWREGFGNRFAKYVRDCKTMREAIDSINKNIRNELLVDYNTKRKRPDQCPSESIQLGMASCSGLSILLTDAFRAVGIPSRIAGTLNWHDNRGNHNWCEVWIDGQWYFTEYYPGPDLNQSWFLADAGKADGTNRNHAIYASSFKTTGTSFPLAWDRDGTLNYVPAVNVTPFYIGLYNAQNTRMQADDKYTVLKVTAYPNEQQTLPEDRQQCNIDIFCGKDQVGGGATCGPKRDANNQLTFHVEKNKTYTLKYNTKKGPVEKIVKVENGSADVSVYLE